MKIANIKSGFLILLCAGSIAGSAQAPMRKFSVNGAARGMFYGDQLDQDLVQEDTITVPRLNGGHVLADLGLNIRPNKWMEIQGMVRVRNDYGGFWGSGVTFDIRQMYVKGVIGGIVRYQLGDINYKMTPYTLWNADQEFFQSSPAIFRQQWDVVNYDHFYDQSNSWRQQGGATEFGFVFKKWVQELNFGAVATRVKASDNNSVNDRLFAGYSVSLLQSKYLQLGINHANLFDIEGTSRNTSVFRNPVYTYTAKAQWSNNQWATVLKGEAGKSSSFYDGNNEAPILNGTFQEGNLNVENKNTGLFVNAIAKRVSPDFNSPGAQTKRIRFGQLPTAFDRITNDQVLRNASIIDLMRESSMYNLQLAPYLMTFSPKYDNITPYGDATPNRQGITAELGWKSKDKKWFISAKQMMLQEMRGEGTIEPRKYSRMQVNAKYATDTLLSAWKRGMELEVSYRTDATTRPGAEMYRGVDLKTNCIAAGATIELVENLDLLAGYQKVEYVGFDFVAVKDQYAQIYNFTEYSVDGSETMKAIGLRYRFGEKSHLSAQLNKYDVIDNTDSSVDYHINQLMLLYTLKF
ncbi:MAG: hypothetical protein RLZZ77_2361 [Bacteroidota bacterium]|jgi:hypothetical protein